MITIYLEMIHAPGFQGCAKIFELTVFFCCKNMWIHLHMLIGDENYDKFCRMQCRDEIAELLSFTLSNT